MSKKKTATSKKRNKKYNPNQIKQRDVDAIFNSMTAIAGTGLKETTISAQRKVPGGALNRLKTRGYDDLIFQVATDRLLSNEEWSVIVFGVAVEENNEITIAERIVRIPNLKPDSPGFTDKVHDSKLDIIEELDERLIGIYTIAVPSLALDDEEVVELVNSTLEQLEYKDLLNREEAHSVYLDRIPPEYRADLEKAGLDQDLAKALRAMHFGFDTDGCVEGIKNAGVA